MKRLLSVSLLALLAAASLGAVRSRRLETAHRQKHQRLRPDAAGAVKILTAGKGFRVETDRRSLLESCEHRDRQLHSKARSR